MDSPWYESNNPYSPLFKSLYDPYSDDPCPYPVDELLSIDPSSKLRFIIDDDNKPSICRVKLLNDSDMDLAFRIKTTNLEKYIVEPQKGVLSAGSQTNVTITFRAWKQRDYSIPCLDRFLFESVRVPTTATVQDITPEMFEKKPGNYVGEYLTGADYCVPDESDSEDDDTEPEPEPEPEPKKTFDLATTVNCSSLSALTMDKQSIIEENNRLQRELELLKRRLRRNNGGNCGGGMSNRLSICYVLLMVSLCFLLVAIL